MLFTKQLLYQLSYTSKKNLTCILAICQNRGEIRRQKVWHCTRKLAENKVAYISTPNSFPYKNFSHSFEVRAKESV
jgi:hypothetical protein